MILIAQAIMILIARGDNDYEHIEIMIFWAHEMIIILIECGDNQTHHFLIIIKKTQNSYGKHDPRACEDIHGFL